MARVIVVGAGVVGLSCAVRLLEAGHRVDVLARDLPLETTSAVAGGLWYPYLAEPVDRVAAWSATTYGVLRGLAADGVDGVDGVRVVAGQELVAPGTPRPAWAGDVEGFEERPAGAATAWRFASPLVEMPRYLPWLTARVEALGGTITRMNLAALPEPVSAGGSGVDVVVNAAGLGARLLGRDPSVVPVRGQVLLVEQTGVEEWALDSRSGHPTYVFPREGSVVVGGTEEHGEWSRTPSPETTAAILERAAALVPAVASARVLRTRVGLRPARPTVRLERVGDVVHCYGHGGAGVTVSWGCAEEVAALVGDA